jgi:hypothetical protein
MLDNTVLFFLNVVGFTIVFRRVSERKFTWPKMLVIASIAALASVGIHVFIGGHFPDIALWVREGRF